MRTVGVATLNAFFRKKQWINAKSERFKCCGLAISRGRQIYAMFGEELRTHRGDFCQILRTHLHTARIVVRMCLDSRVIKNTNFIRPYKHWQYIFHKEGAQKLLRNKIILEWTKLVWTPALGVYLCVSGCPRHVERNYIPLFGVAQSNVDYVIT